MADSLEQAFDRMCVPNPYMPGGTQARPDECCFLRAMVYTPIVLPKKDRYNPNNYRLTLTTADFENTSRLRRVGTLLTNFVPILCQNDSINVMPSLNYANPENTHINFSLSLESAAYPITGPPALQGPVPLVSDPINGGANGNGEAIVLNV